MASSTSTNTPLDSSRTSFYTRAYHPKQDAWPYSARDFTRADESSDTSFYTSPRFVAHIDDAALARLSAYYATVVPLKGRVLDLCTSWNSWYGDPYEKAVNDRSLEVYGIGLNEAEMAANPLLRDYPSRWERLDLNVEPEVAKNRWEGFDSVTCTVSVDYLAKAVDVLQSVRHCTKEGGTIHLAVGNRCFPTKVVRLWLDASPDERLQLVGGKYWYLSGMSILLTYHIDYLHFAGWKDIEIVDLCAKDETGKRTTDDDGTVLGGPKVKWFATQQYDPLWVVRATKRP